MNVKDVQNLGDSAGEPREKPQLQWYRVGYVVSVTYLRYDHYYHPRNPLWYQDGWTSTDSTEVEASSPEEAERKVYNEVAASLLSSIRIYSNPSGTVTISSVTLLEEDEEP